MVNCPQCGKPIPEGQGKCLSCGVKPRGLSVVAVAHINLLKKKIEKEPSNAQLYLDLGDVYQKNGLLREAQSEFQKAVAIDANDFDTQAKLAHLYLGFKDFANAENAFRAALHIDPKSTESLIGLFRAHYLQDKTEEAIVLGEKITQAKPDNVEFHMLLKNLYTRKGDKEKAFAQLEILATLTPGNEQVVREMALHCREKNDMARVVDYYRRLLELKVVDVGLGYEIGKYYYGNGEYEKAIEHLNGLLKQGDIAPGMVASIRTHVALACWDKGDLPGAENIIDGVQPTAVAQMDRDAKHNLAALLFKVAQNALKDHRANRAIACLERAVSYEPGTAEYKQLLDKIRNEVSASNKEVVKKVAMIAGAAIAAGIVVVLAWALTRNRIIMQIEPAEGVVVLIDGKPAPTRVEKPGVISSPVLLMGRHNVVVEKTGYQRWQGSTSIGLGRPARLAVKLVPAHISLRVFSVPESAVVTIDGKFAGKTPFASDRIMASPHVIELTFEGHAPWRANLTVNQQNTIDLGVIRLKNLSGRWSGQVVTDAYARDTTFIMTIKQAGAKLTVNYFYRPNKDASYSGKLPGKITKGEFYAAGSITYKYLNVFYWKTSERNVLIRGKISDNWDRIEGTHQVEELGERAWWVSRR